MVQLKGISNRGCALGHGMMAYVQGEVVGVFDFVRNKETLFQAPDAVPLGVVASTSMALAFFARGNTVLAYPLFPSSDLPFENAEAGSFQLPESVADFKPTDLEAGISAGEIIFVVHSDTLSVQGLVTHDAANDKDVITFDRPTQRNQDEKKELHLGPLKPTQVVHGKVTFAIGADFLLRVSPDGQVRKAFTPVVGSNKQIVVSGSKVLLVTKNAVYSVDQTLRCKLLARVDQDAECHPFLTGLEKDSNPTKVAILSGDQLTLVDL